MSLRRYFKPANKLNEAKRAQGRNESTRQLTPEDRAAIARYAAQNGNSAAVKKFKASHNVGESTVRSFKRSIKSPPWHLIFAIARRQTQKFNTQLASNPRNANIKLRN